MDKSKNSYSVVINIDAWTLKLVNNSPISIIDEKHVISTVQPDRTRQNHKQKFHI